MTDQQRGTQAEGTARPHPGVPSWVAEVSVSPEWFAAQDSSLQPPEPGTPRLVHLTEGYALIGRESDSRDVHPVIDAADDAGCSRRHADLTFTDGVWVLRDLTSVNGTYLLRAGASLPPVEVTQPTRVDQSDQVFVGAWTRIVLRPASEV